MHWLISTIDSDLNFGKINKLLPFPCLCFFKGAEDAFGAAKDLFDASPLGKVTEKVTGYVKDKVTSYAEDMAKELAKDLLKKKLGLVITTKLFKPNILKWFKNR